VKILLIGIGSLVIATTALPFFPTDVWWVRIFDFPRVQIAVVGIGSLIGYLVFRSNAAWLENFFVVALFSSVWYQAYMMFP
jgi:hypothetical protein